MPPRLLLIAIALLAIISIGCAPPAPIATPDPFGDQAPPAPACPDGKCPSGTDGGGIEISNAAPLAPINYLAATESKSADPFACPTCPNVFRPAPMPMASPPASMPMIAPAIAPPASMPMAPPASPAPKSLDASNRHPLTGEPLPSGVRVVAIDGKPVDASPAPKSPPASSPVPAIGDQANAADIPKGGEIKHGAFRCERCGRATVGRQWKEIWADDGTSLLCLCRSCYESTTPTEREDVLRRFAARTKIDLANPAVEAAIKSAAAGD